jgi:hypothetical protein
MLNIRTLIVFATCIIIAVTVSADMRTKSIRLVPETNFEITPQPVTVSIKSKVEGEQVPELMAYLDEYIKIGFEKLEYPVQDNAKLNFELLVDYIDFGNSTKRLLTGGMIGGKGHIEGTITLTSGKKKVGVFRFSSRIRGGITARSLKAMGKEIGPPLVLKLHSGDRDTDIHERPKVKAKKSK